MAHPLQDPASQTAAFKAWMLDKALPLWSSAGFDAARGRFVERLDAHGRPLAGVPHRAMVQARQIYVFAHAASLGWFPEGGKLAEIAMASLLRDYRGRAGAANGFIFSINADARVVSEVNDTYAHAFILLALAWLYRLNGDSELLAIADETIIFIDTYLTDPSNGGLFDCFPAGDRTKRQNPHMHLLEAYMALETAAPARGYIDRAHKIVEMFQTRFFRGDHNVLLEYFAEDWTAHSDEIKRCIFEPGHHFEWVWLLLEFEKVSGTEQAFWVKHLYESARAHGITAKGLIFDEVLTSMTPYKRSHRVWPHAEGAKAAVALHLKGDPNAGSFAVTMVQALTENFLDRPFVGGWNDHLSADRFPLNDYVPASTLYHLFLSLTELTSAFPSEPPSFRS